MSNKPVRDYDKFMLRLPEGMREAMAERAKKNNSSMNTEIVNILDDRLIDDAKMMNVNPDGTIRVTININDINNPEDVALAFKSFSEAVYSTCKNKPT